METREYRNGERPDRAAIEIDRTPLTTMLVLAVVAVIQFVHYYARLPDTLATHFNMAGQPNGWTGRAGFIATMGAIEALFVVGALLFTKFAARIPTGALNIPNRDYWLEPARRSDSLKFVWSHILWIETITLAFLIAVTEVVFRSNLTGGTPALPGNFFYVLVVFVLTIGWLSIRILLRFRRHELD